MAVQTIDIHWKWGYFVEVTNDDAICIICGENFTIGKSKKSARNHLKIIHTNIYKRFFSSLRTRSPEGWQSQFTTQNNKMECKLCGKPYIIVKCITARMENHLERTHEINENKTTEIITHMYNKSYDQNLKKTHICTKCNYTFSVYNYNYNSSDLIKHVMENHQRDIPAEIRPKGLCNELSSSSNYDGEANIDTSINYQQPNVYSWDSDRSKDFSNIPDDDSQKFNMINNMRP